MLIHLLAPKNTNQWKNIWKKCYKIWENSPHQIKIWDNKEIDKLLKEDNYEFYNEYLSKCPNIYKWDYARYIILEKYGGAYFDMDVEVIDGSFLNKLDPNKLYLYGAYTSSGVEPAIMIAKNGYEKAFWILLKEYIIFRIKDTKYKNTIPNTAWKTGPLALTSFYLNWIRNRMIRSENIQILPWELFGNIRNDLSYCVHHYTNSWH